MGEHGHRCGSGMCQAPVLLLVPDNDLTKFYFGVLTLLADKSEILPLQTSKLCH